MESSTWNKIEVVVATLIMLVVLALFGKVYWSDYQKQKFEKERSGSPKGQPLIY